MKPRNITLDGTYMIMEDVTSHLDAICDSWGNKDENFRRVFPRGEDIFGHDDLRYAFVFARDILAKLSSLGEI